jgi:hypothetical protein
MAATNDVVAELDQGDGRWQPARVHMMVLACSRMVPGRQNEGAAGGRSSVWVRAAAVLQTKGVRGEREQQGHVGLVGCLL